MIRLRLFFELRIMRRGNFHGRERKFVAKIHRMGTKMTSVGNEDVNRKFFMGRTGAIASLRLVSPGAATGGVKYPIFP